MNQLIEHENHLIQQFLIIGVQEIKDGTIKIGILNKYPNNEISYLNILDEIIINVIKFFYNQHCFPNGLEIRENKFDEDELFFFSLDNIGTTSSFKYPKIYFECLLFQEKFKDDFFTQKALVLLSFFPLFNEFGIILTNLKKNIFEDTLNVSLEDFIYNLIFEIPIPISGCTIINYSFNNFINLKLTLGEINKIPIPKSDIKILFKYFGINTLEKILTCILLETPILVFCENKKILCNIVKGFEDMIIPFKYPHTIIELLPVVYYSILEKLDVFIIGINKKFINTFFNNENISIRNKNVLVVDVLSEINSKIFFFEGNNEENDLFKTKNDEIKSEIDKIESLKINLPKYYTNKLKIKINELCEEKDGQKKNFQDLNNKDIEGIFYYYYVCLFLKYKSCLNYSEKDLAFNYPLIEKNKIKSSDLFKEEEFLSDIVPIDKLFYQKFFKTEIWKKFLIKTLYCKELKEKMEVILFDEMIRVKRNKKLKLIKSQTPFLDFKKFEYIKDIKCGIKFDKNNNNNNPIPKDYFPLLDYSKLNKKKLINDISFKYIDDFELICLEIINEKKLIDPKAKTNITFNFINNITPKVENYIYKLWFLVFAKCFPFCDKRERWFKYNNFINYIEHKIFHHQSSILDEYLSNFIFLILIKYGDKEMCSMFFKYFKYKSYLNYLFLFINFQKKKKFNFYQKNLVLEKEILIYMN